MALSLSPALFLLLSLHALALLPSPALASSQAIIRLHLASARAHLSAGPAVNSSALGSGVGVYHCGTVNSSALQVLRPIARHAVKL